MHFLNIFFYKILHVLNYYGLIKLVEIKCFHIFKTGKIRGKKIKGKSRSERDSLKEKIPRHDNLNIDDKDETSSTTTDSSTGDQEDKVTII